MIKLIIDWDKSEVSSHVPIIIWVFFIDDCQSNSHNQHHNVSDSHYQTINFLTNIIIYHMVVPYYMCIISIIYE